MRTTQKERCPPFYIRGVSLSNSTKTNRMRRLCCARFMCSAMLSFAKVRQHSCVPREGGTPALFLFQLMPRGKKPEYAPKNLNRKTRLFSAKVSWLEHSKKHTLPCPERCLPMKVLSVPP